MQRCIKAKACTCVLTVLLPLVMGCDAPGFTGPGNGPATVLSSEQGALLYILQPESVTLEDITSSRFTWVVLEPGRDGSAEGEFSAEEIEAIRDGGPCKKTVLAYLSVGEAEVVRDYWDADWVDEEGEPIPRNAPQWLGPSNPDWPDNYKVRYWDPEWQALILGTPEGAAKTPLDRIIDAGYDGVYLDIIDAYEFWSGDEADHELSRTDARARMIEWIRTIADYARSARGKSGFLVFPQNAADIIRDEDEQLDDLSTEYFDAVDGIGIEDLFFDETTAQPQEETQYRLDQLAEFTDRGKTVLVTDYVLSAEFNTANSGDRAGLFYKQAIEHGFLPYAAVEDRELDEIVVLPPESWPLSQPPPECVGD